MSINQGPYTINSIANAIVDLVERADGPVTFASLAREIKGFAAAAPSAWEYLVETPMGELIIWDGMTAEGYGALREVMSGRRVAVLFVSPLPYRQENHICEQANWLPLALVPKSAGNLESPNWLLCASPGYYEHALARAQQEGIAGYRPVAGAKSAHADQAFH